MRGASGFLAASTVVALYGLGPGCGRSTSDGSYVARDAGTLTFTKDIAPILFDPSTSLESKIESIVNLYIDMISVTPDLPLFVLSEIRNHPGQFAKTMNVGHMLRQSAFVQQLALRRPDLHPLHLIMNIMGMTIFPFITMPVFNAVGILDEREFMQLMQERKKLIPGWVKLILESR